MITEKSTYVNKYFPDTQHGNSTLLHVSGEAIAIKRSYIEFDISAIPSVINKATLYVYCHSWGVSGSRTLNAKRTTSTWNDNTMTWNNGQPSVTLTNMAQTSINHNEIPIWKTWDVTNMLNDETSNIFGIQLTDNDETSASSFDYYFHSDEYITISLRPYLLINSYYVSYFTGSDFNNGFSWSNPWLTINKAATTVPDGSTVHIGVSPSTHIGNYTNEPAGNKIAPQNVGVSGIYYVVEAYNGTGGGGTVSIEQNP